ncbi:IclR family transcriptional regulator [uncultured Arthrobacter sp.]|uniref:IclR family transcriptional regulator n=1 Tax=uncultured Arthrobacter sp. TaxID=114050 RepID=UPI0025D36764|nr:IclR family transcriptional regulator [uncultured Arthrobacter sp.]
MTTPSNDVTDGTTNDPPNYPIGSVDNALRLLHLFSEQATVRIADASRELGVARSTAHRMVQMLQYRGLVSQDSETRAYRAGPELVRMALSIVQQLDVRSVAVPVMKQVRDQVNETVHLSELRGDKVLFLNSIEGTRSVRVGSRMGMTMPAHSTSAGKVLLAGLSTQEVRAIYTASRLPSATDQTITSVRDLLAELELARMNGYASNFGESEAGVHAVAVPIRDANSHVRAALAIAAPPERLAKSQLAEMVSVLQPAAKIIGEALPI